MESEKKLVKDVNVRLHSWVLLTVLDLNIVPSNWLIISFIEQAIEHRITSSEYECKSKKAKLEGDIQDKPRQLETLNDRISSLNDPKGIETTIKEYNDEYEQLQSRMKAVFMLAKEKLLISWKEFEDATKRASEEEKQRLIDEAEEKMISLRDEISQLKSDLSRVKFDCCSLKNANVELQEKEKKLEARATDLEGVLTLVRDQLATEKMEKLSLQEKIQSLEEQVVKPQVFAAKASSDADAQARFADVEDHESSIQQGLATRMACITAKLMELQDHAEKAKAEYDARNEEMSGADLLGTGTTSADDNA